jgi:tellurite resistance protein
MLSEEEKDMPRLARLPISIFAVVMGLSGLSISTHKFAEHFDITSIYLLNEYLSIFSLAVFAILSILTILKFIKYPKSLKNEWNHPIKISFFPTISISMLLLSVSLMPWFKEEVYYLFLCGLSLQLFLSLMVINRWIKDAKFETHHMNPAWFIPAVGNVIVPVIAMEYDMVETSWFFFSFGMIFWLILLSIVMNRLFFHTPLPKFLLPTLCILIAPPSVGFIAYFKMIGDIDSFARIIYYIALLFTIIVAMKTLRLMKLSFMLSWWSYSFPMTAITIATFIMAGELQSYTFEIIATFLYAITVSIIVGLFTRTIIAFVQDEI